MNRKGAVVMRLAKIACLAVLAMCLIPTAASARSRWSVNIGFGGGYCGPTYYGGYYGGYRPVGPYRYGGIGYGYNYGYSPSYYREYGPPVVYERPVVIERPVYVEPYGGYYSTPRFYSNPGYVSYSYSTSSYRNGYSYTSYGNYTPYSRSVPGYSYSAYYRR
jgi:hypothetical protein